MKIVIRAGGTGSRLWPLSRKRNPKQFQAVLGSSSLIRTTFERVKPLAHATDDIFVSTNLSLEKKVAEELGEISPENIIIETHLKNTGPAMCLEVCYLERSCSEDEVIASLPSDDYISDAEAFRALLTVSEEFIL